MTAATRLTKLMLGEASVPDEEVAMLNELLSHIVQASRAAWPGVALSEEVFVSHMRTKLPADTSVVATLRKLNAGDLYLACACARGDAEALNAFDKHCLNVLDGALLKLGMTEDFTGDVKQELRRSLLVGDGAPAKILSYAGRGHLRGWVRAVGLHHAFTRSKKEQREIPLENDRLVQAFLPCDNPELDLLKRLYRREFKSAFSDALRSLTDRQRTVLRQQLLDGLTIDELGALYHVHRATAARWLEQARQQVLTTTRELLLERLNVRAPELDSIMRLIESRLEVSLRQLLHRRRRG
jgi:RNA polymerase sigma-70 factor (ECF subfamily)